MNKFQRCEPYLNFRLENFSDFQLFTPNTHIATKENATNVRPLNMYKADLPEKFLNSSYAQNKVKDFNSNFGKRYEGKSFHNLFHFQRNFHNFLWFSALKWKSQRDANLESKLLLFVRKVFSCFKASQELSSLQTSSPWKFFLLPNLSFFKLASG